MRKKNPLRLVGRHSVFDRFASAVTRLAGSPGAFILALGIIAGWALTGPWLDYSETWQLVINTGTTIITFLMVFLIQQSQNKDSRALHTKLNELIASNHRASNRTIAIEDLDASDLEMLHAFYARLAELAKKEGGLKCSHSLDDADQRHAWKSADPESPPRPRKRRPKHPSEG